jgi:hypothetical protein
MDASVGAPAMPSRHESGALPEIIAELARGTPAVALMSNMSQDERTSLLKHLGNYLEAENIRVITIDGIDGESVGIRRFCERLVAASSANSDIRDAAEHLATIFTTPQAGERGLVLVIENADALSPEAIAFAKRLATASEARALSVQLLLFGSPALEFRLPEAGSFAVRRVPSRAAAPERSVGGIARRNWTGHGVAAVGGIVVLFFFLAAASGDRERRSAPDEATATPVVLPVRAARPVALAEHETMPAPEHQAEAVPARPLSDQAGAAEVRARPTRAESPVDAPAPESASPPPDFPRQDAAAQPGTESDAARGSASPPPTTAVAQLVPASQPVPQATPNTPPVATTDTASPPSTVQPEATTPSPADAANAAPPTESPAAASVPTAATEQTPVSPPVPQAAPDAPPAATIQATAPPPTAEPAAAAPSTADAANAAPPTEPPAAASVPTAATEQAPASRPVQQAAPDAVPAATTPAETTPTESPPPTAQPGTVAPSVADADAGNAAPSASTPTATGQVRASEPPAPSAPSSVRSVAPTDAAPPPATAQPDSAAPRSADAAPSAASPAPAIQPPPRAQPSPAANALLARGDELIAIGDVATARIVYERAAALKSGRGATSTGRTYDPSFLRQIGAVGVVPDPETAASWYRKGAAMGDEAAASLLGDLGSSKASQ